MKAATRIQLSLMMFLEFFIWGAWFVTMATYLSYSLHTSGTEIGLAYLTQCIGAVIAPFIVGIIADRYVSAQIILGVLHIVGGILLWFAAQATDFTGFFPILLIYMILYMPTLALVNTISFRQMQEPSKEFPLIRTLGTFGWIVAGFLISRLGWDGEGHESQLVLTFKVASICSLLLGVFSFTLPSTPPLKKGQKVSVGEILGFDAIRLLKNRNYLVFFLASFAISIPLAFYYNSTNTFLKEIGVLNPTEKQTYGQMSELIFMMIMPLLFVRLGVKKMLALGMVAWVLRYIFFGFGNVDANYWMLIGGLVLHGVCYDFFFVTGQIYTDNLAGERFRSAAQGLITLATYGVGMLIGFLLVGPIQDHYQTGEHAHNWHMIWMIPAAFALVVLFLFLIFFKDKSTDGKVTTTTAEAL